MNNGSVMVSVIIPVYNVEKYLERCVDSILKQAMQDFEIILIDDGSIDSSPQICDKYAYKDKRIKVIHKENSRVSAARNDGIRMANGKYISFIDSDDWIESKMYEKMIDKAEDLECDIVMCDFIKRGKDKDYSVSQPIVSGVYDRKRIEEDLFPCLIMFENIEFPPTISNCICLFNRRFLLENNIYYDQDIYYCEDSMFGSKAMYHANKFYYMKYEYFYNYFYNPISTTSTYSNKKWDSYLKINSRLNEYFLQSTFDFSRQLKINMLYFTLNMLTEIGKSKSLFIEKRKACKDIMNNKQVIDVFDYFIIPKVSFGYRMAIKMIKYKLSWSYSLLFYIK